MKKDNIKRDLKKKFPVILEKHKDLFNFLVDEIYSYANYECISKDHKWKSNKVENNCPVCNSKHIVINYKKKFKDSPSEGIDFYDED